MPESEESGLDPAEQPSQPGEECEWRGRAGSTTMNLSLTLWSLR